MPNLAGKLIVFFISLVCSGIFFWVNTQAEVTGSVDVFVNVPQGLIPTPTTTPTEVLGTGFVIPNPQPFAIYNVVISDITTQSAKISWQTDQLATSELYFGETEKYELGVRHGLSFSFSHQLNLTNLKPRTTYHFLIASRNLTNATALMGDFTFTTLDIPDQQPPLPIQDLKIFPSNNQLTLVWKNPPDLDLAGVKIYRHLRYYPTAQSGELVFIGLASSFVDQKVINNHRYYYTVYAYDWAGNLASGVSQSNVPQAKISPLPGQKPEIEPIAPGGEEIPAWLFSYTINKTLPLQLSEEQKIGVLVYDQINFAIPVNIFSKKIDRAILHLKSLSQDAAWVYPLTLSADEKNWQLDFIAPNQTGQYQVDIEIVFTDQSRGHSQFFIEVFPPGRLKNGWLPNKLIKGGVVLLYVFRPETKEWELWPTANIWQPNPRVTTGMGDYGFSVPNGKYYLVLHKEGYWTKITKSFVVANQRINFNLALWPIIPFWWVMVIFGLVGLWQYFRKKQYQSLLRKIHRG